MKIQPTNYTYQNTTNFKSTYPVVHWVCEANGSYAPIANLDLVKKLQGKIVRILNIMVQISKKPKSLKKILFSKKLKWV